MLIVVTNNQWGISTSYATQQGAKQLSDRGKAYTKKIYEIPEAGRTSRGKAIVNFKGSSDSLTFDLGGAGSVQLSFSGSTSVDIKA